MAADMCQQGAMRDMAFERFVQQGRPYQAIASIWKRGQISLNRGAIVDFHLRDFTYVVLYFDATTSRIGMQFTKNSTEDCIKLTHAPSATLISVRNFLSQYAIAHLATQRYKVVWDNHEQLYIISLRSPLQRKERVLKLCQ